MTHSAHNDIESWRHGDNGLRRALQQRNAELPSLPEGFENRMMLKLNNLEQPSKTKGEAPTRTRSLHRLWPLAAALSTAALIAIAFLINQQPKEQPTAKAETGQTATGARGQQSIAATAEQASTASERPMVANATNSADGKKQQPAAASNGTAETQTEALAHTVGTDEEPQPPAAHITSEPSLLAENTSRHEEPATESESKDSTISLSPDDLLIAQTKPSATKPSHPKERPNIINVRARESAPRIALSVNLGTAGNLLAYDDDIDALNNRLPIPGSNRTQNYYFASANGYAYDNNNVGLVKQQYSEDKAAESIIAPYHTTSHKLPVTIGMNVSLNINNLWAAETGLTYTWLTSTTESGDAHHHKRELQRIHYLGLPLRLKFKFFERRNWSAYAAAGGAVGFPVKASLSTTSYTDGSQTSYAEASLSAPVQFSLGAGAGLQYNLNRHFGIYAEPQLQWYIPTNSDITTYRTEHPLRFTPAVGLRWEM